MLQTLKLVFKTKTESTQKFLKQFTLDFVFNACKSVVVGEGRYTKEGPVIKFRQISDNKWINLGRILSLENWWKILLVLRNVTRITLFSGCDMDHLR